MPRYKAKGKKDRTSRISAFSLAFPLFSVLYAEEIWIRFAGGEMSVMRLLFALAAGCFTAALCRLTPWKGINYLLQTVWVLFFSGLFAAQFLCYKAHGVYFSVFVPQQIKNYMPGILEIAPDNLTFLLCMSVPVVLQLTAQGIALLRRRSLLGGFGSAVGMLLLAVILSFVSVTLSFYDADGEASPRRQIEIAYMPEASMETFGILPQTVLDLKFNVLHIAEEEVVHHYIVTEDGQQIELSQDELAAWEREG